MRLLTVVVSMVAALPGIARAQPPGSPRFEVGVQASVQTGQTGAATSTRANGIIIGAATGALGGGALFTWAAVAWP